MRSPAACFLRWRSVALAAACAAASHPSSVSGGDDAAVEAGDEAGDAGEPAPIFIAAAAQRPGDADAGYADLVNDGLRRLRHPVHGVLAGLRGRAAEPAPARPQRGEREHPVRPHAVHDERRGRRRGTELPRLSRRHPGRPDRRRARQHDQRLHGEPRLGGGARPGAAHRPERDRASSRSSSRAATPSSRTRSPSPSASRPPTTSPPRSSRTTTSTTLAWSDTPLLPEPPTYAVPRRRPAVVAHEQEERDVLHGGRPRRPRAHHDDGVDVLHRLRRPGAGHRRVLPRRAGLRRDAAAPPKYPGTIDAALASRGAGRLRGDVRALPRHLRRRRRRIRTSSSPSRTWRPTAILASGAAQFAGAYVRLVQSVVLRPGRAAWRRRPATTRRRSTASGRRRRTSTTARCRRSSRSSTAPRDRRTGRAPSIRARTTSRRWAGSTRPLSTGQDAQSDPNQKKLIYDTTKLGYSAAGHTYGDALSSDDRARRSWSTSRRCEARRARSGGSLASMPRSTLTDILARALRTVRGARSAGVPAAEYYEMQLEAERLRALTRRGLLVGAASAATIAACDSSGSVLPVRGRRRRVGRRGRRGPKAGGPEAEARIPAATRRRRR